MFSVYNIKNIIIIKFENSLSTLLYPNLWESIFERTPKPRRVKTFSATIASISTILHKFRIIDQEKLNYI